MEETASFRRGVVSFSSHLSPATWLGCCFISGIRDYPLKSGFCSRGWYSHSPLDSFRSPNFFHVQGLLRILSVRDLLGVGFLGVDLILPCLTVALTSTQVLPTEGANCRDWV